MPLGNTGVLPAIVLPSRGGAGPCQLQYPGQRSVLVYDGHSWSLTSEQLEKGDQLWRLSLGRASWEVPPSRAKAPRHITNSQLCNLCGAATIAAQLAAVEAAVGRPHKSSTRVQYPNVKTSAVQDWRPEV